MIRMPRTLLLLTLAALLGACGQRGDLYLPSAEREVVLSVPAGATLPTTPAADSEDEEATAPANPAAGAANPPATGQ